MNPINEDTRFGGIERLYGMQGAARLAAAHVCVVGLGGVGSWVVEALARSGIGALTLMDLDEICVSNINRQVPALEKEVGRLKAEVLSERIAQINPRCRVCVLPAFFTELTEPDLFKTPFSFVVDSIDSVLNKARLIDACVRRGIAIITAGGAGGRVDPTQIRITDLAGVTHDRLLQKARKDLRRHFGFPRGRRVSFGVSAVYSPEPASRPETGPPPCQGVPTNLKLNCDTGYGSACFVTGAFGFVMAAHVVNQIVGGLGSAPACVPSGLNTT